MLIQRFRDVSNASARRNKCALFGPFGLHSLVSNSLPTVTVVIPTRPGQAEILALVAATAILISGSRAYAQPVTGRTALPTLESLSSGLLEVISQLRLTHEQHEQVERIIQNETIQLARTRANPNLSVAKIFAQEHVVRMQARRQIAALLTARQAEKVAKIILHDMEQTQRFGYDHSAFFSIPDTY